MFLYPTLESDSANPSRLEHELEEIEKQKSGWRISLGDPDLIESIRKDIHAAWIEADKRQKQLALEIEQHLGRENFLDTVLNPQSILRSLNRLEEVMAENNPTMVNLELSLHIDRIECFEDGRVVLRLCKVGALTDCVDLLKTEDTSGIDLIESDGSAQRKILPRRRAKLRVGTIGPEGKELDSIAIFAADPERFAGLDGRWFEEHEFQLPEKLWYKSHANEVVTERKKGKSYPKLENHFQKSRPTIQKALRYAVQLDPTLEDILEEIPWRKWPETYWNLVEEQAALGKTIKEMALYFDQPEATIGKSLEISQNRE